MAVSLGVPSGTDLEANEEKFREQRMKDEEEKRKAEEERKARVNARQQAEESSTADEPGVPKAHSPADAEEVD